MENENNLIFTNYITGIKGMPLDTIVLITNDIPNNSITFTYSLNNSDSQVITISKSNIKNITYKSKVRMQTINKKVEENETKSMLLSAAVFGGAPLLQLAGNAGFNKLFDSLSNNYNKLDYNSYYELTFETEFNGEPKNIVFSTETNPEQFINSTK